MNQHPYILQPYKGMNTRYRCPECNYRDKTFVRYIDTETRKHLADHVGRCNRESSCGYHYTPKQYFQDNRACQPHTMPYINSKAAIDAIKPASLIPVEVFEQTLKSYEANYFVKFLLPLFGNEITTRLIETYFI